MKKPTGKRRIWLLLAAVICLAGALALFLPRPVGRILPALQRQEIAAVQVTASSDLDSPFVYYYTDNAAEVQAFCESLCAAKASVSGVQTGYRVIRYQENMYDVTVWLTASEKLSFVLTDDGTLYDRALSYALQDAQTTDRLLQLMQTWPPVPQEHASASG